MLRRSAFSLCYSVAEYCVPAWIRSAHVHRLTSSPTALCNSLLWHALTYFPSFLPVISSIAPSPEFKRKETVDKLVAKIVHEDDKCAKT